MKGSFIGCKTCSGHSFVPELRKANKQIDKQPGASPPSGLCGFKGEICCYPVGLPPLHWFSQVVFLIFAIIYQCLIHLGIAMIPSEIEANINHG